MPALPRYLVVAPQGLGDSLQATPLIQALNQQPAAVDVLVMRSGPRALFRALKQVNDVIYLPFWESGRAEFLRALFRERRRPPYDATFLTYPAARREYHVLTRLIPARCRIAHAYEAASIGNMLGLHSTLVPVRPSHNVERNLDLARAAGIEVRGSYQTIVPAEWYGSQIADPALIAIHPGSVDHDGFALKRWPPDRFIKAAQALHADGFKIAVIAGPEEKAVARDIAASVPDAKIFEGNLQQLAAFLKTTAMLISNDTGVAHLAAAVGTPVLALFGPTPVECAPYGPNVIALRPSDCPPCFTPKAGIAGCARGIDFACLKRDLPVDLVVRTACSVLNRPETASAAQGQ